LIVDPQAAINASYLGSDREFPARAGSPDRRIRSADLRRLAHSPLRMCISAWFIPNALDFDHRVAGLRLGSGSSLITEMFNTTYSCMTIAR